MVLLIGMLGIGTALKAIPATAASPDSLIVNRGVVELETGRAGDVSVQMAEEIAGIVDDGSTRRVVPVIGKGPLQSLTDLKFLRGIDLAIVPADALDYAREKRYLSGLENSLTYVVKLYNEEFHLLARPEVKQIADLVGQTVSVDLQGSSTELTVTRLFDLLNLKIRTSADNLPIALEKLRNKQIMAIAYVAAKPSQSLRGLKGTDGLHFLSIPLTKAVTDAYAPTRITADDYPGLVAPEGPIDTIAIGNVLMAADLRMIPDRNRNISQFIDTLFTGFEGLLGPGHDPKWLEVNVAAEIPGWSRHPAAAQWLQRNAPAPTARDAESLKNLFSRFIDERRQASGSAPLSVTDKESLFEQFRAWQRGQAH